MSGPLGSQQWMYATEAEQPFYPYAISNSCRFDGASKFTATPPSASSRTKFTVSFWVKRSTLGADQRLFEGWGGNTSNWTVISFDSADALQIQNRTSGSAVLNYISSAKYRDVSAWYHIVIRFDLVGTGLKVWVNGSEITQWAAATFGTSETYFNSSSYNINIGYYQGASSQYLQGYLTDIHFVDSQALSETDFGEFDSTGTIWRPKEYTGSYGTNGFHLDFADGTSATTLGYDVSGNGNDLTATGLAASDQMLDSPTNNFATLNPIANSISAPSQLGEGNTRRLGSASSSVGETSTFFVSSGSYYFEVCAEDVKNIGNRVGIWSGDQTSYVGYRKDGKKVLGGSTTAYGASYADADIVGVAFDADASTIEFFKNGVSQGQLDYTPSIPAGSLVTPYVHDGSASAGFTAVCNFGQDSTFAGNKTTGSANATDANGYGDFYYTPPSGYLALCTQNLPAPAFDPAQGASPQDAFNVYTDTGANILATAQSDFTDGLFWIKDYQNDLTDHQLLNTVTNTVFESNTDDAERAYSAPSGASVAWSWKAGGNSNIFNVDGIGYATASAADLAGGTQNPTGATVNTEAGIGIYTYTGDGTTKTIAHGLGVTPKVVILKNRTTGGTTWLVYTNAIDGSIDYANLESTVAFATSGRVLTLTTFDHGPAASQGASGSNYIAYVFAEKESFSKFGAFTGNGVADGPFVYLGFRPAFVMVRSTGIGGWYLLDAAREGYNPDNDYLQANNNLSENASDTIDLLSNGFKVRDIDYNASTVKYFYMAFAEQPFKYANAR